MVCVEPGNNPIYNLLPDALSCLSTNPALDKTQFRSIMRHLLSYIKRDKQAESLVEKLTNRFQSTDGTAVRVLALVLCAWRACLVSACVDRAWCVHVSWRKQTQSSGVSSRTALPNYKSATRA